MALEEAVYVESTQGQQDGVTLTISPTSELKVPFQSFMDTEIARFYLMVKEESLEGAVHRELRVTGSDLIM